MIEYRFPDGKPERFSALAAELVALKVDVIMAPPTPAALAAKEATRTLPIVFIGAADPVASGLIVTIELSALAWLLAVALGIVSGALRTVKFRPLRALAAFYVEFFRNVPLLVWMFFWYFAVPPILPEMIREWMFGHGLEFWAGVCTLGVYSGARFSEVLRSGIQSIPRAQMEAAVASGLTTFQAYSYVILPVALQIIIPPGTSESLNLLKNSSVALTISVAELTFPTRQIETYTAKAIEALTAGTLIYLVLCVGIASLMSWVERRTAIPGLITAGGRRRR